MPKILWTKTGIEAEIQAALPGFQHQFLEVILTVMLPVVPFDLKNNSLIFSSVNGVKGFVENGFWFLSNAGNLAKVYCVGTKTATELQKYQIQPEIIKRDGATLGAWLSDNVSGGNFIHFCGNLAADILPQHSAHLYRKIPVYETRLLFPKIAADAEAVVFFSPSGVRSFLKENSVGNAGIFSIGESTTQELRRHGLEAIITSRESSLPDLVSLVQQYFELQQ